MPSEKSTSLKIEKKEIVYIKPLISVSPCTLSLSILDRKDINNNLCQTVHVYRRSSLENHDFDSGSNSYVIFKEALSKALCFYYPLAGRLEKPSENENLRVVFDANNAEFGVPFLEATANCSLDSLNYLDNADTEVAKQLVFDPPSPQDKCYPLVVMVTQFICGGITIGMGLSHAVCDGFGASQFFNAIVEIAKGRNEPTVKPIWEREIFDHLVATKKPIQCLMDKESSTFSPLLQPETVIKQYCFKVKAEEIQRLKMRLVEGNDKESTHITTFESLAAYVWRARARALRLHNNGKTMLTLLVSMRRNVMEIPLPKGYYGNSIVDGNIILNVAELIENPLNEIVQRIKTAKNDAFTKDYIKNYIMNALDTNHEDEFIMESSGAVTVLTEWKHLGFQGSIDFGGFEAVNFVIAPCNMFQLVGTCIFMSPCKLDDQDPSMKGGARIFITLPVDAMPKFKEEMEALNVS
ncbi:putative transferase [Medicago truncatula]|uniref:HXXXD-type acyl-transferase family protein n=1 Tax=Medicago truncatula TaxID=3880 RepID=A0A072U9C7_MEDTR|nr:spermidine coumaroyl-CoA acyltransferase-like [Medicago truncatula]KEH26399.1 HXXXD-type acyl-transferase family protein [Medicago truncatula]RHN51606.1 putative transferase [Medicago truncatula]